MRLLSDHPGAGAPAGGVSPRLDADPRPRHDGAMGQISDYPVADIGEWPHGVLHGPRARELAAEATFWEGTELSCEELTRRIRLTARIDPAHAPEARTYRTGEILLVKGCHRWAVANKLGISSVPVKMEFEEEPEHEQWAWPP